MFDRGFRWNCVPDLEGFGPDGLIHFLAKTFEAIEVIEVLGPGNIHVSCACFCLQPLAAGRVVEADAQGIG